MAKILIVDDDKDIRDMLKVILSTGHYDIVEAKDGSEAVELCEDVQLIVLDVMMPKLDGINACIKIREKSKAPIMFLTAKGQDYDKMAGLSAGGDDYLVKPFTPLEFQARVNALLRRWNEYGSNLKPNLSNPPIYIGELVIHVDSCKVEKVDTEIKLTAVEYKILHLLAKTKGKVFSAQNIYESVWEEPYFYSANNTVMVHIRKLREKIESDPQNPKYIKTVWGMGYKIDSK